VAEIIQAEVIDLGPIEQAFKTSFHTFGSNAPAWRAGLVLKLQRCFGGRFANCGLPELRDVVEVFGKRSRDWHFEKACGFRMNDDRAI